MTTVQSQVTDQQSLDAFFYLRISGLPYYFFATIDPSSSRYGSFAWPTPTSYPDGWNRGGLMLPDDSIEQKLSDLIGGIATPGRVRLSVTDFPDPTSQGFGFLSRLFAPGRFLADSSVTKAKLTSTVHTDSTTIDVRGADATFSGPLDVYLGAETIGVGIVSGPDGDGASSLSIDDRNKYACFGNTQDDPDTVFPPIPYHLVATDPSGGDAAGAQVSTIPGAILGRSAALWMGHMRPDGNPEPESSSACLLLGRIANLDIGKIGGVFDITLESITADLAAGTVAPGLAQATIAPAIYLQHSAWGKLVLTYKLNKIDIVDSGRGSGDSQAESFTIDVPTGDYTPQELADEVTALIHATTGSTADMTAHLVNTRLLVFDPGDGTLPRFRFEISDPPIFNQYFIEVSVSYPTYLFSSVGFGLLSALGFDENTESFKLDSFFLVTNVMHWTVDAQKPLTSVFIPTKSLDHATPSTTIALNETGSASSFFLDQNDGSLKAYVRFGDGQIVQIISASSTTIDVGASTTGFGDSITGFYFVSTPDIATVEQIAIIVDKVDGTSPGGHALFLGQLLASTTGQSGDSINVFPEGVGMGWLSIITEADWLIDFEGLIARRLYVDRSTKFSDVFTPIAREHGLFIVWDPSASRVRLRAIQIPQPANAATFAFNESNRAKVDDRTSQRLDLTSLRTSWKIQGGWDWSTQQWTIGPVIVNDVAARSNYPNNARQEVIEDKTLTLPDGIGRALADRTGLYGSAWTSCQRSVNKTGMLLAPGTIHQVIDNTMVNPYTGATGITSTDKVYGFLMAISSNPATGEVTATFAVNSADDNAQYRQWSPTALVDFSATTNGYVDGTKTLTLVSHYTNYTTGADGRDFRVGDKVIITARDGSSLGSFYQAPAEIATISTDGVTVVLVSALGFSLNTDTDTIMILDVYGHSQTTARKTGDDRVAWQGNGTTRVIDSPSTVRLNKWG